MESLWDDLCRHAPDKLTQPWHEEILLQRERAESVGEAQFIDWDAAKKKLSLGDCPIKGTVPLDDKIEII